MNLNKLKGERDEKFSVRSVRFGQDGENVTFTGYEDDHCGKVLQIDGDDVQISLSIEDLKELTKEHIEMLSKEGIYVGFERPEGFIISSTTHLKDDCSDDLGYSSIMRELCFNKPMQLLEMLNISIDGLNLFKFSLEYKVEEGEDKTYLVSRMFLNSDECNSKKNFTIVKYECDKCYDPSNMNFTDIIQIPEEFKPFVKDKLDALGDLSSIIPQGIYSKITCGSSYLFILAIAIIALFI